MPELNFSTFRSATRVSELDLYAIYRVKNCTFILPQTVILQFQGLSNSKSGMSYFLMSDGHIFDEFIANEDVWFELKSQKLALFDIVQAEILYHRNSGFHLNFVKLIYTGLSRSIGHPILTSEFENNGLKNF